jgi:hypothetical protein
MKELIDYIEVEKIQKYIEEKENVKLVLVIKNLSECKKEGHISHYDTGDTNHMLWCRYSASTLLSKDYKGGEFVFLDENDNEIESFNQDTHYMKTLVFDVGNKHKVKPHYDGDRRVNLYFWKSLKPIKLPDCVKNYIEQNSILFS